MFSRVIALVFICSTGLPALAQPSPDSLTLRQRKDSLLAKHKAILANREALMRQADCTQAYFSASATRRFSFRERNSRTFMRNCSSNTSYLCLSGTGRFRYLVYRCGPVLLSEGNYTLRGDTLLLTTQADISAAFLNAFLQETDWSYVFQSVDTKLFRLQGNRVYPIKATSSGAATCKETPMVE